MDKFIELITKAWDKCEGNRLKQGLLVLLALAATAIIITAIYFYWWLIVIVIAVIANYAFEANKRSNMIKRQAQQRINNIKNSVAYTLRHSFDGLADDFGLTSTKGKGLVDIAHCKFKNGVSFFKAVYLRKPNRPDLEPEECEPLRGLLNSEIQSKSGHLPYENVMYVDVYVSEVQTADGKLVISVIPLVDIASRETAEKHYRLITEKAIIGKTEKSKTSANKGGELTDDEL